MEYNKKYIDRLLDLYYRAETTIEQERELKRLLVDISESELSPQQRIAKAILGHCSKVSDSTSGFAVDTEFMARDSLKKSDGKAKGRHPGRSIKTRWMYAASVAAIAAIIVIIGGVVNRDRAAAGDDMVIYGYLNGEPITNPEIAARQIKMISRIAESSVRISESGMAVIKELEIMEQIQKVLSAIDEKDKIQPDNENPEY